MFAGDDDTDSVISFDMHAAAAHRGTGDHLKVVSGALCPDDASRPVSGFRRVSRMEAEFGWSGSAGGIKGRSGRQIERDAEFERQIEERRRRRKERKMKEAGLADAMMGSTDGMAPPSKSYRPVFAPDENALASVERKGVSATPAPDNGVKQAQRPGVERSQSAGAPMVVGGERVSSLKRGMSLKDKVGAALGRWGSRRADQSPQSGRARAATTGGIGALAAQPDEPSEGGKLTGLARKLSRKLADPAIEERRRRHLIPVEPPKLSHVLVGERSPFPPRAPLGKMAGHATPGFDHAGAAATTGRAIGYTRAEYGKPQQPVVV